MPVYRCDWCGRFYSSPLPEGSACDAHVHDHNERHRRDIERFNAKIEARQQAVSKDSAASLPNSDPNGGRVEHKINGLSEFPKDGGHG